MVGLNPFTKIESSCFTHQGCITCHIGGGGGGGGGQGGQGGQGGGRGGGGRGGAGGGGASVLARNTSWSFGLFVNTKQP